MKKIIFYGLFLHFIFFYSAHQHFCAAQKAYRIIGNVNNRAEAILEWTSKFAEEYPSPVTGNSRRYATYPGMLNLFEDRYFVPVFGEAFDEISQKKRASLASSLSFTFSNDKWRDQFTWQTDVLGPFTDRGRATAREVIDFVTKRRAARKEYEEMIKKLSAQRAIFSYDVIDDYKRTASARFQDFWPSEREKLNNLLRGHEQIAAEHVLQDAVAAVSRSDNSYSSLMAAEKFRSQHSRMISLLDRETVARVTQPVTDKIATILDKLMEDEQRSLAAISTDDKGIQAMNEWWGAFASRYAAHMESAAAVAMKARYAKRRTETLTQILPQLESRIGNADDKNELRVMRSLYLATPSPQNEVTRDLAARIDARERLLDERERAQRAQLAKEAKERERIAEANGPKFITEGLSNEAFFRSIWKGDFVNAKMNREDVLFSMLFNAYISAYSSSCESSLPSTKIPITRRECETERVTRNGYGIETSRYCISWRDVPTGYYASPEMYSARSTVEGLQARDALQNVFGMLLGGNPIGEASSLAARGESYKSDMHVLIALNGCNSPGLKRFEENLRRFALNIQPVLLEGMVSPELATEGLKADNQDFSRLVNDLIAEQSKTWAINKYQPRSVSNLAIVAKDIQGRPLEIRANYLFQGWGGNTNGSVRITFVKGLPECLYFSDFPDNCKSADKTVVAGYVNGQYRR